MIKHSIACFNALPLLVAASLIVGSFGVTCPAFADVDNDKSKADCNPLTSSAKSEPCSKQDSASAATTQNDAPILQGEVRTEENLALDNCLSELVALGEKRRSDAEINGRDKHYGTMTSRLHSAGKNLLELGTSYKGFEQSSEAADIILGEKEKLKSKAACEYLKQKHKDAIERDVLICLMQIAEGVGMTDKTRGQECIDSGTTKLKIVVGDEAAQNALKTVTDWCASTKIDENAFKAGPWSICESEQKSRTVLDSAMKADPAISEIRGSLHKFNGRSKVARVTAKVVNTGLSIAALSPTIISPACQIAWTLFIATQGGPEQAKLLREVYLSKRFESRWTVLDEQSRLAVNSHNLAVATKNPSLLLVSDYFINRAPKSANAGTVSTVPVSAINESMIFAKCGQECAISSENSAKQRTATIGELQ